jgi:hypothetical protein
LKEQFLIKKASGQTVPFMPERLKRSLHKAGATDEEAAKILEQISSRLFNGISTKRIYRMAFDALKRSSGHKAARYHLKKGIMELGPSGFPFEKFIAEILKWQGYETRTGVIAHGKCVSHEVDVIAEKGIEYIMVECKYHNRPGLYCDVKIPLYVHSRFRDLNTAWTSIPGRQDKMYTGWLVTNTRFSLDAIQYGVCAGLKLIGWDYPANGGLKDQIDRLGLYPITCLTSLNKTEKQFLLDKNIVLTNELYNNVQYLYNIGLSEPRVTIVQEELRKLCQPS